jgi:hypothetical protein
LDDGGWLAAAIDARDVAKAVAKHKNAFFMEKTQKANGSIIFRRSTKA